jgi:hypothetical protein
MPVHVADPFDIQDRATHLLTVGDEPRLLAEVDANLAKKGKKRQKKGDATLL